MLLTLDSPKFYVNFTLFMVDPSNSRVATNMKHFEIEVANHNTSTQVDAETVKPKEIDSNWVPKLSQDGLQDVDYWVERDRYKKLCRGDKISTVSLL